MKEEMIIMKKTLGILMAGMMVLSSIGCAASSPAPETTAAVKTSATVETTATAETTTLAETTDTAAQADTITGGWNRPESPEITSDLEELCRKALDGMTGVSYTPAALLNTQVVAGTNYRILFRAAATVPESEEVYAIGTIYEDLNGNATLEDLQMTSVKTDFNDLEGGWRPSESPSLTDEVQNAFDTALDGLTGVDYIPFALLGTQTVAGTNYAVLCEATVVYPDAEPYYAIVYLYEDLGGNSELTDIINLETEPTAQ